MGQKSAPLISVIVAVFNGRATLRQCIDSVWQQTYPNKELIVIDGGSKDGTVDILNANLGKMAYCISEPDRGIYNAWNKGLAQAKGDWICFLGADDFFWDTEVLARMAIQLERIPLSISVAYGQIVMLDVDGRELYSMGAPWQEAGKFFKQQMSIPHPALMHRKSMFERHGNFDESFHVAGDYEMLLRELKTGDAVFIPGIITAGVRAGGISMLPGNTLKSLWELGRAQRMHGQPLSVSFLLRTAGKELLRLLLRTVRPVRKLRDHMGRRIRDLQPHRTNKV